jgi:hypothetical protein
MATKKQANSLIGRKCVIDFACRWKGYPQPIQDQEKALYTRRDDWNKTGEVVSYEPGDESGKSIVVLRDDTGLIERYYHGEVTITGPAPDPEAGVVALLTEIRNLLNRALLPK